jgi:hypothetical protein
LRSEVRATLPPVIPQCRIPNITLVSWGVFTRHAIACGFLAKIMIL